MKNILRAAVLGIFALPLPALAHGPTPQKVEESVQIAAPPTTVWAALKDFADIGSWHSGLAKSSGDSGCASGVSRTITLKSGGDLVEGVDECNEAERAIYYRLSKENIDAFPVSSYSGKIEVQPAEGGSTVNWTSRLYRADTTNEPAENRNDDAAVAAVSAFFKAGLEGLKAKLEKK